MTTKILMPAMALLMAATAQSREITGTIINENKAPLDFANVVLYCDSTYVAGSISDADGNFTIAADDCANLTAKVMAAGYENYTAPVPESGCVGAISLVPAAVQLNELVVKATRPITTMKGNALVTNVEDSRLAIAGTANDVLVRVPMVVDNSGTLEVFGKGAPAVYINGRKVNDLQELSQLNSQDIKNVEVIANPGAAYGAEVKSVIRIRTKAPKGDGWSGTLWTDNGFLRDFRTGNSIDLKYRTGALEVFANYGWWHGYNITDKTDDMTTASARGNYLQKIHTSWKERYNDMNGRIGFSWLISGQHSVGAYYRNGRNDHSMTGSTPTEVWEIGTLTEIINTEMDNRSYAWPMHSANAYYNGTIGRLSVDFNADYMWTKQRQESYNNEVAELGADRVVTTCAHNRNRMFAEKLVLGYPVWRGRIEIGEEYTATRASNVFTTNIAEIGSTDNRTDESNMAAFVEIGQQFGRFSIAAGLRYEHVRYNYYETGMHRDDLSKTYNNIFPSLELSTRLGAVNMGLSYTGKTVRPGYGDLDGTVSYINRLTYETGNPYLKPTRLHTVEYTAQWQRFFAQLSYSCVKDGVYHVTEPYEAAPGATLIKTANLSRRHCLQAFAGAQFRVGTWQPRINAGMTKQWLTLPVNGAAMKMNTPGFLIQWQNSVKLPLDIWLNIDAQLMTRTWDNNIKLTNTPWYVNAKLYKGFFGGALGMTLEAKDIFESAQKDAYLCSDAVKIVQTNFSPGRTVMLTLQYSFNTTRDRYRGTGAGNSEKARF